MFNKKQILSLVFKAILIIACGYGMLDNIGVERFYRFNYYTVLSNSIVLMYFFTSFIWGIKQLIFNHNKITFRPGLLVNIVYLIAITLLVYSFLLAPSDIIAGNFWTIHNITVHYIVPIMVIIYWLLYCPKGIIKHQTPILLIRFPLVYFIYIILRAMIVGNIDQLGTPYPYNFMDAAKYGWGTVSVNLIFIFFGLFILGYLFYRIDNYFGKINKD